MKMPLAIAIATTLSLGSSLVKADLIVGRDVSEQNSSVEKIDALFSDNQDYPGQHRQLGDHLRGTEYDDVINGGLGSDILFGYQGNDILVGGTKDFDSTGRDFAFGQEGDDIMLWEPGDGDDFFDGGQGNDVLIVSRIVGQSNEKGSQLFIDSESGYPSVDLFRTPGYCDITASSDTRSDQYNPAYLVQFHFHERNTDMDRRLPAEGQIRMAVHLENTEFVVCPTVGGDGIDVFDLRRSTISKTVTRVLPAKAYRLVEGDRIDVSSKVFQ